MTDHPATHDSDSRSSMPRSRIRQEQQMAGDSAIPDAVFAEPRFSKDRAGFGLLAGRNTLIQVSVGPGPREIRVGRFNGTRRHAATAADVADVLGMSVAETEGYVDKVERALRAGITAYQETYLDGAAPTPPTTLDEGLHSPGPAGPDSAERMNERQDRNAVESRAVRHPPPPLGLSSPFDVGRNESGRSTGRSL